MGDITPEKLRRVAEYMGYTVTTNCNNEWAVNKGEGSGCWNYDPRLRENSDQCLELMEKLKLCVVPTWEDYWTAIDFDNDDDPSYGDTINEAVTLAAIAYVEHNSIGEE